MVDQARKLEIIEKIKACFRRSDTSRGASQAEAETSVKMAKRLMASYNISQAEVIENDEGANIVEEAGVEHRKHLAKYETQLILVCQYLFNVKSIIRSRWRPGTRKENTIVFIGYEVDVALAKAAYKIIRDEVNALAAKSKFKDQARDDFRMGVALSLSEKAKQMAAGLSSTEENICRAVVVSKGAVIQRYLDEKHGKLKARRGLEQDLSEGLLHGVLAGKNMNIDFSKKLEAI